jgi:hypothetical protein
MLFNNLIGMNKTGAYALLRQMGYKSRGTNLIPAATTTANTVVQDGNANLIRTVAAGGFQTSYEVVFKLAAVVAGTAVAKNVRLTQYAASNSPVEIVLVSLSAAQVGLVIIEGVIRCYGTSQLRFYGTVKTDYAYTTFNTSATGLDLTVNSHSLRVESWYGAGNVSDSVTILKFDVTPLVPEF